MRKLLLVALAATALAPSIAGAQTAGEVRRDQREVRHDQREVNRDLARGDYQEAREDARETRRDQRETTRDWRDYRQTHRGVYHRPAYVAPRGYRYRQVAVGTTLNRAFWGSRYRIGNYNTYRLPYPGRNRMYVRHGHDVLLINARNGRVIRVYNRFFW
jgi:Ni/Co efflux regulator RcnB|uniref:RcnB family protein n=1 Tax=Altererythrobacter segetis TaxID=1104773 RepID=UPI001407F154|nr:RcnB family protein [Altererythrobacter segetis]